LNEVHKPVHPAIIVLHTSAVRHEVVLSETFQQTKWLYPTPHTRAQRPSNFDGALNKQPLRLLLRWLREPVFETDNWASSSCEMNMYH
jgi:hypothetical protein